MRRLLSSIGTFPSLQACSKVSCKVIEFKNRNPAFSSFKLDETYSAISGVFSKEINWS